MPTPSSSFRISQQSKSTISRLAKARGKSMSEMIELAIFHLDGTLKNGLPVYMNEPEPDQPQRHKKASRVA